MNTEQDIEDRQKEILHDLALKKGREYKGQVHGGKRADLDSMYLRCGWEANVARMLNALGVSWQYEPRTFWFPQRSGTNSYTPDFYLPENDKWIEVKGYWNGKSKTQLRRFKRYHFEEFQKLYIVTGNIWGNSKSARSIRRFLLCDLNLMSAPERIVNYNELDTRLGSIITNWE